MDGFSASIGNLVAEGNKEKIIKIFWEVYCINFVIGGFLIFSLYHLLEPFIRLWLGQILTLNHNILILINIFIMETRKAVDMFNMAYGNYGDTWSAWVEGSINILVTIITAIHWGIIGILLGKIISLFLLSFCGNLITCFCAVKKNIYTGIEYLRLSNHFYSSVLAKSLYSNYDTNKS